MTGVSLLKFHDRLRNFNHDNNESDTSRNDSQTVTMHRHFSVITGDIYLLYWLKILVNKAAATRKEDAKKIPGSF